MAKDPNNYKGSKMTKDEYIARRDVNSRANPYHIDLYKVNPITKIKNKIKAIFNKDNWSIHGRELPYKDKNDVVKFKENEDNIYNKFTKKVNKLMTPKGIIKAAKTAATATALGLAGKYILDKRRENLAYNYDLANRMFKPVPIHKKGYSNPYLHNNERLRGGHIKVKMSPKPKSYRGPTSKSGPKK